MSDTTPDFGLRTTQFLARAPPHLPPLPRHVLRRPGAPAAVAARRAGVDLRAPSRRRAPRAASAETGAARPAIEIRLRPDPTSVFRFRPMSMWQKPKIDPVGYPRDSGSPCRLWSAAAIPCGRLGRFRVVRPQERPRHPRASRQPGKTPLGAVFSGPRPPAAANGSPLRVRACRQPGKTPRRASFSGSTRRQPPMARWVLRPLLRFVIPESPVSHSRHRRLFIRIETTTHGGYLSQVDSPHRPDLFSRAHPAIDPCATC